jgi:hypothetical protein
VNGAAYLPQQHRRHGISPKERVDEETILKGVGLNVHLLNPNTASDLDLMFATRHVKGVGD